MDSEGPLKHRTPPDEHLLCFDFLYYVGVLRPWEWDEEYDPAWQVASKMHFAPRMVRLANDFLMRLFDAQTEDDIPPVRLESHMLSGQHLTNMWWVFFF